MGDFMNVGIDMVKIDRFEKLKDNPTFLNKVFCENEVTYLEKRNFNLATMAGMFAAKEAFLKTLKKGLDSYPLNDIEISHNDDGAPFFMFHSNLAKYNDNILLSISHDGDYAISLVVNNIV